ncbi:MAG: HEAT repeat domain-containing protein [Salinispira sp.]
MKIIGVFLIILSISVGAENIDTEGEDQTTDQTTDQTAEWKKTLQFGIEQNVLSTIDSMIEEKSDILTEEVSALFGSRRDSLRIKVMDFFEAFESDDLIPLVIDELQFYQDGTSPQFTARLIEHLSERRHSINEDLWDLFQEMLQEEGNLVKSTIIAYLGDSQYQPAAVILEELYTKADQSLQENILRSLGKIQDENSRSLIFDLIQDENIDRSLRIAAVYAAGSYADAAALEQIIRLVSAQDIFLRTAAVSALSEFSSPDVQELYLEALRDEQWRIRLNVLKSIEKDPFPQSFPALEYMAKNDPETVIRQQALQSISALNIDEGWEFLRTILTDTMFAESYRRSAAILLIQNDFAASSDIIEDIMMNEWDKKDSRLLDAICKELSITELSAAAGLYEKMLRHSNFVIQIYGVRGIGRNRIFALRQNLEAIADRKNINSSLKRNIEEALKQL